MPCCVMGYIQELKTDCSPAVSGNELTIALNNSGIVAEVGWFHGEFIVSKSFLQAVKMKTPEKRNIIIVYRMSFMIAEF